MRDATEAAALVQPKRRAPVALDQLGEALQPFAEDVEAGGRPAERPRDHEHVSGNGARPSGHPLAAADRGHRERERVGSGGVSSGQGKARLRQALVELDDCLRGGLGGNARLTSSASGSAPSAARSLRLTAAAL